MFKYSEELPIVASILIIFSIAVFTSAIVVVYVKNPSWEYKETIAVIAFLIFTLYQVFNPILPVSLVAGQIKSALRLRHNGIITLDPSRVPICGKMRILCLDKTGTLTKDRMTCKDVEFWKLDAVPKGHPDPQQFLTKKRNDCNVYKELCLATCHSLVFAPPMTRGRKG